MLTTKLSCTPQVVRHIILAPCIIRPLQPQSWTLSTRGYAAQYSQQHVQDDYTETNRLFHRLAHVVMKLKTEIVDLTENFVRSFIYNTPSSLKLLVKTSLRLYIKHLQYIHVHIYMTYICSIYIYIYISIWFLYTVCISYILIQVHSILVNIRVIHWMHVLFSINNQKNLQKVLNTSVHNNHQIYMEITKAEDKEFNKTQEIKEQYWMWSEHWSQLIMCWKHAWFHYKRLKKHFTYKGALSNNRSVSTALGRPSSKFKA